MPPRAGFVSPARSRRDFPSTNASRRNRTRADPSVRWLWRNCPRSLARMTGRSCLRSRCRTSAGCRRSPVPAVRRGRSKRNAWSSEVSWGVSFFGRSGVRGSGRPSVHGNPVPADMRGASRHRLKMHENRVRREGGRQRGQPGFIACRTAEIQKRNSRRPENGAGDGNRTHVASLEGWSSTIELRPRREESRRIVRKGAGRVKLRRKPAKSALPPGAGAA